MKNINYKMQRFRSVSYTHLKNAFVVIPTPLNIGEQEIYLPPSWEATNPKDDFVAYYKALKNIDVPIFITSDSLLHYYHIFFDTTLMRMERDLFYQDIWTISRELFEACLLYTSGACSR